jgi:hypothetical protein
MYDRTQHIQGIYVADSTKVINTIPTTDNGIWSQLQDSVIQEPYVDPMESIYTRLTKLETQNKFLKLKILGMEGKFTQEEIANIRAMLISNDEASVTLADSIIENA